MKKYFYQEKRFSPYLWNGLNAGRGRGLYFDPSSSKMMEAFRTIVSFLQDKNIDYKTTFRCNAKIPYYRIYVSRKTYNEMDDNTMNQISDISLRCIYNV